MTHLPLRLPKGRIRCLFKFAADLLCKRRQNSISRYLLFSVVTDCRAALSSGLQATSSSCCAVATWVCPRLAGIIIDGAGRLSSETSGSPVVASLAGGDHMGNGRLPRVIFGMRLLLVRLLPLLLTIRSMAAETSSGHNSCGLILIAGIGGSSSALAMIALLPCIFTPLTNGV